MCFFRYHHFVHVNSPQALSSPNSMHVAPFFLLVYLDHRRPSCVDSFLSYSFTPPNVVHPPILSLSFVALVKSLVGTLPSVLPLSRGGAGLRAVFLFCLCIYEQ